MWLVEGRRPAIKYKIWAFLMFLINPQLENDHWQHTKKVHKVDKIQLLGMMAHRILPENTTITIWTKMQVKISSANCIKHELIPVEAEQRVFRCFNSSEKDLSSA